MERDRIKTAVDKKDAGVDNTLLAFKVVSSALSSGVRDYCLCPGARNAALIDLLKESEGVNCYTFYDERAAAFFAVGRSRAEERPVAVITTSGTAVGELFPAVMEAFYSAVPLLLITADRPRSFRGSGAPQSCEQKDLFGYYTPFSLDVAFGEHFSLEGWSQQTPAHLNVCFDESYHHDLNTLPDLPPVAPRRSPSLKQQDASSLATFLEEANTPFAIVSALPRQDRESVVTFLRTVEIPFYAEGVSGIREEPSLEEWRLKSVERLWEHSEKGGYPIDALLRIGSVPTTRIWRDLESKKSSLKLFSLSQYPYSGLSWGSVVSADISSYLAGDFPKTAAGTRARELISYDRKERERLRKLFEKEPHSEPAIVRKIAEIIPAHARLYLGNSLPIREWDLFAKYRDKGLSLFASRGVNGIDGQLSTFLGLTDPGVANWAILGDLTALYDLSAPWIVQQIEAKNITIVVINNGGGKIFSRLFANPWLQNCHSFSLKGVADLWQIDYMRCDGAADFPGDAKKARLVEWFPDEKSTKRFWQGMADG